MLCCFRQTALYAAAFLFECLVKTNGFIQVTVILIVVINL